MKISVCMATYNGEKYIYEQIESILYQLREQDEIIVSDDHSGDNTIEIIKSFNDNRIKIIFNNGERGYTANFENALNHATGDIIFLSDQDDVWLNGKVDKMLRLLESSDLVVSDVEIVDTNLNLINSSHFRLHNVKDGFWNNFLFTRYIGASMAFKQEILKKVLPFPSKKSLCAHDYWITIVSEAYYNVKLLNEPTLKYRRHESNASTGGLKSKNSLLKKLINRFYSLIKLVERRGS